MADPIFALRVNHREGGHTYWAFDVPSEYRRALTHLGLRGVKFHAYHAVTDDGQAVNLNHGIPGDTWASLSGGLNDSDELLNCLSERGDI